jgi:hypothetical protein
LKIARIRTATVFSKRRDVMDLSKFIDSMKSFEDFNIEVRTKRVVVDRNEFSDGDLVAFSKDIDEMGYWGFCVSFDDPTDESQIASAIKLIKGTENGFVNFKISKSGDGFDSNKITPSAKLIEEISRENEGIDNFRLGFSFGLEEETPFFPYASMNGKTGFAVGLEYIDLLEEVINKHRRKPLGEIRKELKSRICWWLDKVTECCKKIEKISGFEFLGVDISLAPYPYPLEDQSVAGLIEILGNVARSRGDMGYRFGMNGTMFVHTFLTGVMKEIVSSGKYKTTGFNGIMYSVLEDSVLSTRFSNREIGVSDLLLLSTTCGCGIDMMPLSDRNPQKAISSLFFDIFAISSVLTKPLGIRALPIPNSRPGDLTMFKHLFFTNAILPEVSSGVSFNELPSQIDDSIIGF